ncbi:MAG: TonB family protein [Acidobacteria bacterium]|nr:TonB family protein [Acidobacteriota bacterium]
MSTHAPSGGLRPALPPTLQPMAIALAAPRTDRRTALLASAVVYLFIPAALMAAGRMIPQVSISRPTTGGGDIIFEPTSTPVVLPSPSSGPRPAVPALATSQIPSGPAVVDPRVEENPESLIPSSTLPTGPIAPLGNGPSTGDPLAKPGGPGTGPFVPGTTGSGEGGPLQISSDAVRILHQDAPVYPTLARAARVQGDVIVRMFIDTRGVPTSVRVEQGHPALRATAEQSAMLWRFTAAQVNGQAVPATFLLTLKFRLH